jgi:periplasmic divalent cation tolerance protein
MMAILAEWRRSRPGAEVRKTMDDYVVVFSTIGRVEDAETMARALVEGGLAACVNVIPTIVSIYRWKGCVEREEERLLVIKTRRERFEELRRAIVSRHPYEVPEIVALPLVGGHAPYLAWIDECVGTGRTPAADPSGSGPGGGTS